MKGANEAETRWSLFVVKHNIPFQVSDHATKLFRTMFPDSKIAKKFACGHTKTTAIVKEVLAPHYQKSIIDNPYSIMIDESNDSSDKSCIILIRVFDQEVGNVCTRFVDMPVVNIGSAKNIFEALSDSLKNSGLNFTKAIALLCQTQQVS